MLTQTKAKISVLIIDDHPPLRAGIRAMLEGLSDISVIGEAETEMEAEKLVVKLHPKIILLDLKMPNFSPSTFERWVRENYPDTITLVLTAHDCDALLSSMMDAGVSGYLDKKLRAGQLISAIRRAARGEFLFDQGQIERARQWREGVSQKWESLSGREREVLLLLTEGQDNGAIATSLGRSINTVEKHLKNIYRKLGVSSRTEAVHWWLETGTDFRTRRKRRKVS